MTYELTNGKKVRIPDTDLDRIEKGLGISREEAIEIWLEDEGYEVNEEQEALDQTAKASRITQTIHGARAEGGKKRTPTRKEDKTKEGIIALLAETLKETAEDVKIENIGKIITFKLGEDTFKLDLIRQRKPKNSA